MSVRVEFRLSMPSRGSWNGQWSGEGRNYAIVKRMGKRALAALIPGGGERRWYYRWSDGWSACVTARVVPTGERLRKSEGFCGYDWMVRSIILHDAIIPPSEGAAS